MREYKNSKYKLLLGFFLLFSAIFITGFMFSVNIKDGRDSVQLATNFNDNTIVSVLGSTENLGEWVVQEIDVATGTSYMLVDHFGGFWADAEKEPGSDGEGDSGNPGEDDDLLCWAATASNMLEWTGWGFIGGMEDGNSEDFFDYYIDHITDYGYYTDIGLEWWFDGDLHSAANPGEKVDHTGFWTAYTPSTYISNDGNDANTLPNIRTALMNGRAVGIGIYPLTPPGGHAITVWGFNYDNSFTPADPEYYLGIWVSDSDSHKGMVSPPDVLRYYAIDYNSTAGHYFMPNYGSGWFLGSVTTISVFPGEQRPIATIANIIGYEGSPITFDASASSDPDGDSLRYRWDFDGDGTWDTAWSPSATATHTWQDDYTGTVYLEVFDGRLRDIDTADVTVLNVAPVLDTTPVVIDENGMAIISGTITDPGVLDTFTLTIDWGEGAPETFSYSAGTTTFTLIHQYLDDNPTGTPSDNYIVSISIEDDDGGSDSVYPIVTVNNVIPNVLIDSVAQENLFELGENIVIMLDPATFTAIATDIGTDDLTITWNWGDGTPTESTFYPYTSSPVSIVDMKEHVYAEPGDYIITITVIDDDTGVSQDTLAIKVLGPKDLKQMAIDELEMLKTGKFCSDVKIEHIIRSIEHSLCDKFWEDDIHLNPKFGTCVFCHEMEAVRHIELQIVHNEHLIWKYEKIIACLESKGKDASAYYSMVADLEAENLFYESIVLKIVKADELIARVALDDAENTPVQNSIFQDNVDYKLSKATKYINFANDHVENSDFSRAILDFKMSWQYSQCAIKLANKV